MALGHFSITENVGDGLWIKPCFTLAWDGCFLSGFQDTGVGYKVE
jgi:hypothetical protein